MGEAAVPALAVYLADATKGEYPRWTVASGLQKIAEKHLAARPAAVAALVRQLEHAAENPPTLNAGLVSCLLNLKEVAAAPVIEEAFAGDHVDESITGDWEDARYELGLRPDRPQYDRSFFRCFPGYGPDVSPSHSPNTPKKQAKQRAAKRKQARKDRKRNRKK